MQRTKQPDFNTPLIPIDNVEEEFLSKLIECEEFFIHHQRQAINENIYTFKKRITPNERHKKNKLKGKISQQFIDYFDLKRLDDDNHISRASGKQPVPDYYTGEHSRNFSFGNFYERTEMKNASWTKRIDIDGITFSNFSYYFVLIIGFSLIIETFARLFFESSFFLHLLKSQFNKLEKD